MNKLIITSGDKYTDIDVLACCIAYKELLSYDGSVGVVVLPGKLNTSVIPEIESWDISFKKQIVEEDLKAVIMDVSDSNLIASFVDQDTIVGIYDHHFGFEDYWRKILGDKAIIEPVGACATLVWEEFVNRNSESYISTVSANLLYTAIISNTLNFKSSVTHKRDVIAYEALRKYTKLPDNWVEHYFREQEKFIYHDIESAIENDTKIQKMSDPKKSIAIGQVELWNSKAFVEENKAVIKKSLSNFNLPLWFLTSPSISEGINYIYTDNDEVKTIVSRMLDVDFVDDLAMTQRLWLRKEILRELQNYKLK